MVIVAVDDTDSRERGMCTTYVGTRIAEALTREGGRVQRQLLIRLNPSVKHKTRGNAAVAIHVDEVGPDRAFELASETVRTFAAVDDPRTSPGVVVADIDAGSESSREQRSERIPDPVATVSRRALRERLSLADAVSCIEDHEFRHAAFGSGGATDADAVSGRGRIGALAAIGAPAAFDDWTTEVISYRALDRCGTPRDVDRDSVFAAATAAYPAVWDTVDRETGSVVCVPNAPGPILHGIRGDDPDACQTVAAAIASEPVERSATFLTNQGTDAHLAAPGIEDTGTGSTVVLRDGAGYRITGTVATEPVTKRGGHVHVELSTDGVGDASASASTRTAESASEARIRCLAFKPTGRFRDRVRRLRPGDRVTVCGEHEHRPDDAELQATLKLEKFAVRSLVRTTRAVPRCPDCDRSMSSAGRNQGYRCRDCGTTAPGKVDRTLERALELGWYEVPPSARRHIAKPLIRGGFDAPIHPER